MLEISERKQQFLKRERKIMAILSLMIQDYIYDKTGYWPYA